MDDDIINRPIIKMNKEFDDNYLREKELSCYGFYLTNHPVSKYNSIKIMNINKYLFKNISIYLLVENIKNIKTKKNDDMAFLSCSDETGFIDVTVFPSYYNLIKDLKKDDVVLIYGEVTKRFDKIQIVLKKLKIMVNN